MDVQKLQQWYYRNMRDLPWRRTKDPYLIWISEIIMQQTRVDQGLPYYIRFSEAFPLLHDLAFAQEQSVLKLWQGLGYYSRARNMHAAAKEIVALHHGVFPDSFPEIRKLKGIGDYTAAAIASMAFDLPHPVVDGNVLRFFSRFYGIERAIDSTETKREIHQLALGIIPKDNPGDFNQAIMEFGARICTPRSPDCNQCVLKTDCFAFAHKVTDRLPVKGKKANQRKRYFHYLVIRIDGKKGVYLEKREETDIWKNLFHFPMIETANPCTLKKLMAGDDWKEKVDQNNLILKGRSGIYKHLLTHQQISAWFYELESKKMLSGKWHFVYLTEIHKYPFPRLIEKYVASFYPPSSL